MQRPVSPRQLVFKREVWGDEEEVWGGRGVGVGVGAWRWGVGVGGCKIFMLVTGSTDRSKPEEAEPVGTRMLFRVQLVQKWTHGLFSLAVVAFALRFNR